MCTLSGSGTLSDGAVAGQSSRIDVCPYCHQRYSNKLGQHIISIHGHIAFNSTVLGAISRGMTDAQILATYQVTPADLDSVMLEQLGINVAKLTKTLKKVATQEPRRFTEEKTTVWSFKQRGSWATHDGSYRGNWSPYVPRNLILKYSGPGETVLDYFLGGGTTAVEAVLLGRRFIGRDINPLAVAFAAKKLAFGNESLVSDTHPIFQPDIAVGDARDLSDISDESVDLICAHPPYADIITYSKTQEGDISRLPKEEFLREMQAVAHESHRVLRAGHKCAVLIGDARHHGRIVPLGFETIAVYLRAGFRLREMVIKRQHNCRSTGMWSNSSLRHNFLLLAHEYLAVFEKPPVNETTVGNSRAGFSRAESFIQVVGAAPVDNLDRPETTSVWVFPSADARALTIANLSRRYGALALMKTTACQSDSAGRPVPSEREGISSDESRLVILDLTSFPDGLGTSQCDVCLGAVQAQVDRCCTHIADLASLAICVRDTRTGDDVQPLALHVVDRLRGHPLALKEIIVVVHTPDDMAGDPGPHLRRVHEYVLVYERSAP